MFTTVLNDLKILGLFLVIGFVLRKVIKPLQKLYIPAGIIGGIVFLILGPQVLGLIEVPESWGSIASPAVEVVITCMIFGTVFNFKNANKMINVFACERFGYCTQVVLGIVLGSLLASVWTTLPDEWGIMAVFSFYGGHGGAISAANIFEQGGVENMMNLGILFSTFGLIIAMAVGMFWVNRNIRKGNLVSVDVDTIKNEVSPVPKDQQRILGHETVPSAAVNGIAWQFAIIACCMLLGKVILNGLGQFIPLIQKMPTMLHGIIGAFILYPIMVKCKLDGYADIPTIKNIGGVFLELTVLSAVATLNLKFLADNLVPILIFTAVFIVVISFYTQFLFPKWMKNIGCAYEVATYFFGSETGVTATGYALLRCMDPKMQTDAWSCIGLISWGTAISQTLIALIPTLLVAGTSKWVICAFFLCEGIVWAVVGTLYYKKGKPAA